MTLSTSIYTVFVFFFSLGHTIVADSDGYLDCQNPFDLRFKSKCYFISNSVYRNFTQAKKHCADLSAILAEPVNSTESDWLASKVSAFTSRDYYIGIRNNDERYGVTGKWTLESSGNEVTFKDWGPGNPKYWNTTGCVVLRRPENWFSPKWYDESCYLRKHFICEKSRGCRSPFNDKLKDKCYMFRETATDVFEAKESCQRFGSILAEPVTSEESNFLTSRAPDINNPPWKSYYIAVRYQGPPPRKGQWMLESSGVQATFTDWDAGMPSYITGAKCVTLSKRGTSQSFKWHDGPCNAFITFICQKSAAADECNENALCLNGGKCTDTADGPPTCICPTGATGRKCETDLQNQCHSNPCYEMPETYCRDLSFDYQCVCTRGYTGKNCEINIDECASMPCLNGGICTDYWANFQCQCPPQWYGRRCEDYKSCHVQQCRNSGTCVDHVDNTSRLGYHCLCPKGLEGVHCEIDTVDQCITAPCRKESSTCTDMYLDYKCNCRPGWTGIHCDRQDECASEPCQHGGTCIDGFNRYDCNCTSIWHGTQCQIVNGNMCDLSAILCGSTGPCRSNPCTDGKKCYNKCYPDCYVCLCPTGYTGDGCRTRVCPVGYIGSNCETSIYWNKPYCNNGGTFSRSTGDCICKYGWHGSMCEDYNSCIVSSCVNGGTCTDHPDGDRNKQSCKCPSGTSGKYCETDIANQCASNPCKQQSTCTDRTFGYLCSCVLGWSGRTCEIAVDECGSWPCQNGAHCTDGLNKYECSCREGWKGESCGEVNSCGSSPCRNNGVCSDFSGSFMCACSSEYVGNTCQYKKPSGLYTDCPHFVRVKETVRCNCSLKQAGDPPATPAWRGGPLEIISVQLNDHERKETCEYSWENAGQKERGEIVYTLFVADGPTNVKITASPPGRFVTDGGQTVTLLCQGNVSPDALYTWSAKDKDGAARAVACRGGNSQATCILTPDPVSDNDLTVICLMQNVLLPEYNGTAEFTVSFNWTGVARVLMFEVDESPEHKLVDVEGAGVPLTLKCLAVGNPAPLVNVFLVNNASSGDGESADIKTPNASRKIHDFKLLKYYTIASPSDCQTTDAYRCDTSNKGGDHNDYIKVRASCVSSPEEAPTEPYVLAITIGTCVLAVLGVTICILIKIRPHLPMPVPDSTHVDRSRQEEVQMSRVCHLHPEPAGSKPGP